MAVHQRIGGQDIHYQTVMDGRLLHVRKQAHQTVDVGACFQNVCAGAAPCMNLLLL